MHRVQIFNYGYLEGKNKPSALKLDDNSKHLGLNTIVCSPQYPTYLWREKKYWNFLLLLLQIVNIVFSPILTDGMISYLKHLICDHHNMFKVLFLDKKLIPKHHLMIHYPRCITKIGVCDSKQNIIFKKGL